jgi:hypothetical protein
VHKVVQGQEVTKVVLDHKEHREQLDRQDHKVLWVIKVHKVVQGQEVTKVLLDHKVLKELLDRKGHKVP